MLGENEYFDKIFEKQGICHNNSPLVNSYNGEKSEVFFIQIGSMVQAGQIFEDQRNLSACLFCFRFFYHHLRKIFRIEILFLVWLDTGLGPQAETMLPN